MRIPQMTRLNLLTDAATRSKSKTPGFYLDGRGLYLQVAPGGSRSWVLRYAMDGRTREMGLGSLLDFGLAAARERAQAARLLIADGIDPIKQRRERRAAQVAESKQAISEQLQRVTFEQCAEECHRYQADEWKSAKHAAQWINTLRTYVFKRFGGLPVSEFDKAVVVQVLTPIWKEKAETASRVLQRMRTVLNYAAAKDYCAGKDSEFWEQVKLALGPNTRARQVEHHASCPYLEVADLLEKIEASSATQMVKLAFEFTVLTSARSAEAREANWTELDAHLSQWTLPSERMKAGKEHRVPLSGRAKAVLQAARALQKVEGLDGSANPRNLVFPNPSGKPYSDMVFTQLMRRLKLPYTMHGFRSSFRTWGQEATDYPHEMLEHALAHTVGDQTVRAYARSDMVAKRRQLMEDWAALVESAQLKTSANEQRRAPQNC